MDELTCPDCGRTYQGHEAHCCQVRIWIDGKGRRRVTRDIRSEQTGQIGLSDSATTNEEQT